MGTVYGVHVHYVVLYALCTCALCKLSNLNVLNVVNTWSIFEFDVPMLIWSTYMQSFIILRRPIIDLSWKQTDGQTDGHTTRSHSCGILNNLIQFISRKTVIFISELQICSQHCFCCFWSTVDTHLESKMWKLLLYSIIGLGSSLAMNESEILGSKYILFTILHCM